MRLRTRLVLAFVGTHLLLTLALAITAWWWLERERQAQAATSAAAVERVLAQGGFSLTPEVQTRMATLTGYALSLDGGQVRADWRTAGYQADRRTLALAVATWSVGGAALFAALAWWLAGRIARPVEGLATLGAFATTIAHEVRNPLSAVRLTLQGVATRLPHEPGLRLVVDEVERLDLIVDELLAYGRGLSIRPAPVDLRPVVDDVVRLLSRQAAHLGVTLLVADGEGRVTADAQRLRQVLLNLVLNALQAAAQGEAGTPHVTIQVLADGFTVEDNGPGLPHDLRDRLFQPFVSGRHDGTGLGLHLAQAIAEAHGARLTADDRQGGGACFRLRGLTPAAGADRGPGAVDHH